MNNIPNRGTKEFTEYAISVMKAAADGKVILIRDPNNTNRWKVHSEYHPRWDWHNRDYCVKLEPKTVPLTADDIPACCWMKKNTVNNFNLMNFVAYIDDTGVSFANGDILSFIRMMNDWQYSSDRKVWKLCHKIEN